MPTAAVADPPSAGVASHEAIDNAIAGPLLHAISEQLGGRAVDMQLDAVEVQPVDSRDRSVSGTGSLRIDGDDERMGFRFQVLYDSQLDSTSYPEVSMGGVAAGERDIPNDAQLVQQIQDKVVAAVSKEFRQQPASVWLQLDRISTVEGGSHYLGITAQGVAYLGVAGSTRMKIEALYDRSSSQWLWLHYGLGDGGEQSSRNPAIVSMPAAKSASLA